MTGKESKRMKPSVAQRPKSAKQRTAVNPRRIKAWNQFLALAMKPEPERQP